MVPTEGSVPLREHVSARLQHKLSEADQMLQIAEWANSSPTFASEVQRYLVMTQAVFRATRSLSEALEEARQGSCLQQPTSKPEVHLQCLASTLLSIEQSIVVVCRRPSCCLAAPPHCNGRLRFRFYMLQQVDFTRQAFLLWAWSLNSPSTAADWDAC